MTHRLRWVVGLTAWAAALFGVLWIERLPHDLDDIIPCGIWGCLPPLQALAAGHAFWIVLLGPITAFVGKTAPPHWSRLSGMLAVVAGVGGLAIVVGDTWINWCAHVPPGQRIHAGRRIVFVVASWVDFPMLQLLGAGVCLLGMAQHRPSV
jgi:hypothetical protein